jgi:predicted nucleic acid-binding protein
MSSGPPLLVIDTSVAVKWYVSQGEDHVEAAWSLLQDHHAERCVLAAPAHLRLELMNVLKNRGYTGSMLLDACDRLDLAFLEWHDLDGALVRAAAGLAAHHNLTLYDAAFAALALALDAELVTADRRLAASGAGRVRLLGG